MREGSVFIRSGSTRWITARRQAAPCAFALLLAAPAAAAQTTHSLFISPATSDVGTAQITSSPAGINCVRRPSSYPNTGTCSAQFAEGTIVTLIVTPIKGGTFEGWTEACSGTATTCQVSMATNRVVGVRIAAKLYTVTVLGLSGSNGGGQVEAGQLIGTPDIDCWIAPGGVTSSNCVSQYPAEERLDLYHSTSVNYSRWAGYGGDCTGGSCSLIVDGNKTVTGGWIATELIIATAGGSGAGKITGVATNLPEVGSFDCSITATAATGKCSGKWWTRSPPPSITITATPAIGSVFAGWSGACTVTSTTCVVPFSSIDIFTVNASFAPAPAQTFRLTVSNTLEATSLGTAQITSSPAGIDCTNEPAPVPNKGTCAFDFPAGTNVSLTATPLFEGTFNNWLGACTGTTNPCQVAMSENRTVDAVVTAKLYTLTVNGLSTSNSSGRVQGNSAAIGAAPNIDCRIGPGGNTTGVCSRQYAAHRTVFLFNETAANSAARFVISGACANADCQIVMNGNKALTAGWIAAEVLVSSAGGPGAGTVTWGPTSNPSGPFNCAMNGANTTGVCSAKYETTSGLPSSWTLTATPANGSTFAGWSGKCTGTSPTCVIPYETNLLPVAANFVAGSQSSFRLRVANTLENSRGTARVVSSPAGIDCTSEPSPLPSTGTCQADFDEGTVVTLTATALHGGTFDGWAGACTGTGTCQVTMTDDRSIDPKVSPIFYTLTVLGLSTANASGHASDGDDIGSPGINCFVGAGGSSTQTCQSQYPANQTAKLFRETGAGSFARFAGWSGACTGTDFSCTVAMNGNKTVTLGWIAPEIIIGTAGGNGTGKVTGIATNNDVGAFDCAISASSTTGACAAKWETRQPPPSIMLSATPTGNSVFAGWSGGGCSGTGPCVVHVTTDIIAVSALFTTVTTFVVSVAGEGTGSGTVGSNPAGISCTVNAATTSQTCSAPFAQGASVTLSASPTGGSTFGGWSGACSGTTPTCSVTVNAAALATARFAAPRPVAELARALLGEIMLTADERRELDKFGNNDGAFNLGDLLALMNRTGQRLSPAVLRTLSTRTHDDGSRPQRRTP